MKNINQLIGVSSVTAPSALVDLSLKPNAQTDRAAEWLQAMLADDATEHHLEQVTTSLIDSINRRNTAGLLLAQRAIELERQKRKPD